MTTITVRLHHIYSKYSINTVHPGYDLLTFYCRHELNDLSDNENNALACGTSQCIVVLWYIHLEPFRYRESQIFPIQ